MGCKEDPLGNKEEFKSSTRILNDVLKTYLIQLIELQQTTFDEKSDVFYAYITPTEKAVYVKVTTMDCGDGNSFYRFVEKIDKQTVHFTVAETSETKNFLDLNGLTLEHSAHDDAPICEDWYWVMAKLNRYEGKLRLEKLVTFYDNDYETHFYDPSDSLLMQQLNLFESEPEPPVGFE